MKMKMKIKRPPWKLQKSGKRSIHLKGQWKAVDLDPSLLSEQAMGGLVCFEELTDYRLVDTETAAAKSAREVKKERRQPKKRTASSEAEDGDGDGGEGTTGTAEKPVKKKKRRKKNKKKPPGEEESTKPDQVSVDGEVKQEEGGEGEASKEDESQQTAPSCDVDAQLQSKSSKMNEKKKKRKRKRKNKRQAEKDTSPEAQGELASPADVAAPAEEKPSQDKVAKLPKKQNNWTNAGASGSADLEADVSAWKDLFVPAPVLKALSSLGFGSPTPIQALALPSAIRDHMDIVGAAETGSGKTLSFGIPMIHNILEWRKDSERRDLAEDQSEPEGLIIPAAEESTETGTAAASGPTETSADSATEQDSEHNAEDDDDDDDDEEGGGVRAQDGVDADDDDASEDDRLVEGEEERLGCVKVIENAEFDFDTTADAAEQSPGGQNRPLLGLVLTPTRELAVQVKCHIDAVAKFTDIRTALLVGGMAQQKQRRMLKRRPEIVIATPGRLWDLITEGHPHLLNLRPLRCLVIDEADRMVERGHFAELESLLEMLNTVHANPKRQIFVFSATLTMAHNLPTRVLQKKKKNWDRRSRLEVLMDKVGIRSKPKVIDLTRKEATVETLTETRIHCEKDDKDFYLYYFLLQYPGRTMVFANSIDCIKRLNSLLVILDRTPLPLHANMHQKQRLKNLERFAERESCVLLTTDVAARGLDIPNVQHVIHYQVPRTSETYVHRSGRTARATKEGLSLLLISPEDVMNFKKIYRTLGKDEELPLFPVQTRCMDAIKERVNLARKIEKIEFHNGRKKQHNSWFRQAAEALELDLDDDVLIGAGSDEDEGDRLQHKMVKGMKSHLKQLLSQPVFKNFTKTRYPTQMGKLALPQMPLAGVESALTSVAAQQKKQMQKKKKQQQ